MNKALILLGVAIAVSACDGVGGAGANPSLTSTANGNCNPITTANQCLITLSYNANGVSNLTLGVTYIPQQLSQFTIEPSLSACPTPSGNSAQSCVLTVTYASTGTPAFETLNFTLGNQNPQGVNISGN